MNRGYALVAVTIAAMVVAFVSGASVSSSGAKPVDEKKVEGEKPTVAIGHKTAVFNMAAVMRDFGQAKYKVWQLNNKRTEMSKNLLAMRSEYIKIEQHLRQNPDAPDKEDKQERQLELVRKIEDEDRKISKKLNDDASIIIGDLYDKMKAAVDETAEQYGFQLVFAYPDAATPEEMQSNYVKELKLKPPAAQPFHVAPEVDITARVVKLLNEKHPPIDPETREPVDVSKLEMPLPPPATPLPKPLKIPSAPNTLPRATPAPKPLKIPLPPDEIPPAR